MAISIKSLTTWKKEDVRYHFTDGNKLIHDSKRYYIGSKAPENEVRIKSRGDDVSYQYIARGSEPHKYTWSVTNIKLGGTVWYTGSSLPGVYDRFSNSIRSEWTIWDDKGTGTHSKSAIQTDKFIKKEKKAGRR